jgi:hypothetical protein
MANWKSRSVRARARRARIVELWATIKYLGRQGIDDLVYGLHQRAVQFAHEL